MLSTAIILLKIKMFYLPLGTGICFYSNRHYIHGMIHMAFIVSQYTTQKLYCSHTFCQSYSTLYQKCPHTFSVNHHFLCPLHILSTKVKQVPARICSNDHHIHLAYLASVILDSGYNVKGSTIAPLKRQVRCHVYSPSRVFHLLFL